MSCKCVAGPIAVRRVSPFRGHSCILLMFDSVGSSSMFQLDLIQVDDAAGRVYVQFTPTIPHCSMATLIGLCIRVKLRRSLPRRLKARVQITPGTHTSEAAINKQLNDKERVAAAMENEHLLEVVNRCIADTDPLEEDWESKMLELEDDGGHEEDAMDGLRLDL